jgi:hypothetical protein
MVTSMVQVFSASYLKFSLYRHILLSDHITQRQFDTGIWNAIVGTTRQIILNFLPQVRVSCLSKALYIFPVGT